MRQSRAMAALRRPRMACPAIGYRNFYQHYDSLQSYHILRLVAVVSAVSLPD
jgi:hypothetical protein